MRKYTHYLRYTLMCILFAYLFAFSESQHIVYTQDITDEITFAVIGDYGNSGVNAEALSMMIDSWSPDFIITVGDNTYGDGTVEDQIVPYYGEYISRSNDKPNRFFPAIGNHDYTDGEGIDDYLSYFELPGPGYLARNTSGNDRYYDYVIGNTHFFVLNTNAEEPDGYTEDSIQAQWLQREMERSTSRWNIVYLHHAPFSSDTIHGGDRFSRWDFEAWGADAVLAGHAHTYERIIRDENEDGREIPYFVVGFSGRGLYGLKTDPDSWAEGSKFRYNEHYGAMRVKISDNRILYEAWSLDTGGIMIDSYTQYKPQSCTYMYNDLGYKPGQLDNNITLISAEYGRNDLPDKGYLIDYSTGETTSVFLEVSGGEYNMDGDAGDTRVKGDAAIIFEGILDSNGTLARNDGEGSSEYVLYTFSELDPTMEYSVVYYTHREGPREITWERALQVSIMSADYFTNNSTPRDDDRQIPVFSSLRDPSTRYAANNPDGHIVRFDNILAGSDNTFSLITTWDGSVDEKPLEIRGLYSNALMLAACRR